MTDSLKFGPEWVRKLAGDGCNAGGGGANNLTTPRYQLAEHRYGREEMLALFDRNYKAPDPLTGFTGLYVPKPQLPLALINMTEEENRLWSGGVTASSSRGRGGSVDRGGRTRSARPGAHYRGGFDDVGEGPRVETQPFPMRTRAFDRPPNERGWSERNGAVDSVEWNGSTSPRKEITRSTSGGAFMESNWRRHRAGEDDDGWRINAKGEKWVKGSWRDSDKERERGEGDEEKRVERWDHKGNNRAFDPHPPPLRRSRSNHHDNHDNLPEWATTDNLNESGGSFDASGAFHGLHSDDEDEHGGERPPGTKRRVRRVSESNAPNPNKSVIGGPKISANSRKLERPLNGERPKSMHEAKDQQMLDNDRRHSLSPISSPPVPSSPASKKPPTSAQIVSQQSVNTADTKKKEKEKEKKLEKLKETMGLNPSAAAKSKSKLDSPRKVEEAKQTAEHNIVNEARVPRQQQQQPVKSKTPTMPSARVQPPHLAAPPRQPLPTRTASASMSDDDKQTDNLDRLEEEVAKLIDLKDERPPSSSMSSSTGVNDPAVVTVTQSTSVILEKWFYRDPQGEVQGPFMASEMAEWHKQGYFAPNLLVRRTCDERYTTLGDLVALCGTVPFKPGTNFPPLKVTDSHLGSVVTGGIPPVLPAGLPPVNPGLPKPGMEDLLYQYQYRMMQNQLYGKQLRANAIAKLSQSEQWSSLSQMEQNQLVQHHMRLIDPDFTDVPQPSAMPFMPTLAQQPPQPAPPSNSVLQLFPQLHQQIAKTPAETAPPIDPIQQLMQQMSGMRNLPPMPQPSMHQPPQEDNPIKSWLRQMGVNANGHVQPQPVPPQPPQMESVWHQQPPPPHLSAFNAQNWMSQVGAIQPTMPPGQMPGSLWDVHPKEMKTEQQILEEQSMKILEEKKKEELRKKDELERHQIEQERAKRLQEEELARLKAAEEANKREDAQRKKREEEKRRTDEEKRKQEEEQRKIEERRRKEEERRREEKRKHDEEANKKKQEEEKKKRDELKRQEEKLRKEEEKRRKIEEEQRKQEEERIRKEEEARKKAEAEEQAKKAEQRRREAEALRKLQERSKAPWAQAPPPAPPTAQASLAEIQRLEREKKAEELRIQQLLQQQQMAQQKAAEAAQEALTDSAKRLQFKWAEKVAPITTVNQVKSLAQIQAEEQERVAKSKQQERQKQEKEKASQKEAAVPVQNISIWGAASQSLTWTSSSSQNAAGFWDDLTLKVNQNVPKSAPVPKPAAKPPQAASVSKTTVQQQQQQALQQQQQQQQQSQQQQQLQQQNNKVAKNKNKKEEELVKKLFEQNTAKTDDFTQWCNKALIGLQVSVDIPTFIGFLRDIEAAYEVKEYVRMYLGDGKQCSEFAKQFLEKRSKWRSSQRPQHEADDLCVPAPAVNPNASTEFQEVKSKSKKPKKGKMSKVDSKMLGFSVMSAPDRINVGDRDYVEGV